MLDDICSVIDHSLGSFLSKLSVRIRIRPCGLDFDIRINRLGSVFITIHNLDERIALSRSDCSDHIGFCHGRGNNAFHICGLLAGHHIGCDIICLCIRFRADEADIRIGLCYFKRRFTEFKSMSDDDVITGSGIISKSSGNIRRIQILCIVQCVAVFLAGFLCTFIRTLVPALVIGCSGEAKCHFKPGCTFCCFPDTGC